MKWSGLLLLILANMAQGQVRVSGAVAELKSEQWSATGLRWELVDGGPEGALRISLDRFVSAQAGAPPLSQVRVDCPKGQFSTVRVSCPGGTLQALLGETPVSGQLDLQWSPEAMQLSLRFRAWQGDWNLTYDGQQLDLAVRGLAVVGLLGQATQWLPEDWSFADTARASIEGRWHPQNGVEARFSLDSLSFDSSAGTVAAADLVLGGSVSLSPDSAWSLALTLNSGELLVDPLYLSLSALPDVSLTASGDLPAAGGVLINRFELGDGESMRLTGGGGINPDLRIDALQLEIEQLTLPLGYERFLAPVAETLGASGLTPGGSLLGRVNLDSQGLSRVTLSLQDFSLRDASERYGLSAVNGVVDYDTSGDSLDSSLSWERLRYYSLVIGAGDARFFAGGGQFSLLSPLFLPILDGGVQIHELALGDIGSPAMSMDFRADIQPMSLAQITEGLGWPVMNGQLSGEIPAVRLRDQVLEVGGVIAVDVFDGTLDIRNLRLERIFGVLPTLAADLALDNIDLEQLTGAFSFGRIEGRLDGQVLGLRMLDWRPVAFDLDLHSSTDSKSRRKISQRAVDNLSSIGGGVAALSQTVLRFFDDFSYRRLGISCRLVNDTCFMGGVAPAGNGYYLVEGSGIPRIDVKGFARQVDWPRLVDRLQAATRSGGATIQ